jgi:hypothetical protein
MKQPAEFHRPPNHSLAFTPWQSSFLTAIIFIAPSLSATT